MPNGGFGCAYCVFYTQSLCNLRKIRITNDHWTVCANITYPENNPLFSGAFPRPSAMQIEGTEIKGSIYAITSDEGAYVQAPWLEDGEIHVVNSMRTCVVCQASQTKGKGIAWRGEKYFFCSYSHYLAWRDDQIREKNVDAELCDPQTLKYFNDFRELQIIKENTTQEQRDEANKKSEQRDEANKKSEEGSSTGYIWRGLFFIFGIKIALIIYHAIVN